MSKRIDYIMSPSSPYVYLGHERLRALAREQGAAVNLMPADFVRIFSVSGGLPLKQRAPQRQAYRLVEIERWSRFLDLPLNLHPAHFPVSGDLASRWIIAASEQSEAAGLDLAGGCLRAVWTEERDIADAATLGAIARACGLDADALATRAGTPEIAGRYERNTEEAIERQVFGAPTYFYAGEPFWGQDRLDFLARKLAK